MKKMIVFLMAVLMCVSLALPVCAAEQEFVPSITYKDGLVAVEATMNGEAVGDCIVVTSIKEAKEKTTDIYQESRDLLLEVYEKLSDGTMKLPLEGDYVILELVDISFAKTTCVEETTHEHEQWLKEAGNTITVDLGYLSKNLDLVILSYKDGQWNEIEDVTDNGDGTYACVFEDICPVAFCVEADAMADPPATGDSSGVMLWLAVMMICAAALVAIPAVYRRRSVR